MRTTDPRPDAELLRATAREAEAFGAFYARHVDDVLRFFARRVADRDAVADLTAETFAAALIGVDRFDERLGTPSAWLFGIARHQLSRHLRRGAVEQRARRELGLAPATLSAAELEAVAGDELALLAELPDEQRVAIQARVVDERPYPDIARGLGVSEPAVRQRVSRGLTALRRRLRAEGS